eukprot:jgi/Picsp_1/2225/NSC_05689-R1_hypothetical protein CHLNCDRAFT_135280 [Chlorella variabilis]
MGENEEASKSTSTSVNQPQYDQVSILQGDLERLCSLLYTSIGSLQRDAPPQDLDGEMILKQRQQAVLQYSLEEQVAIFGNDIASSLKQMHSDIEKLPNMDGTVKQEMEELVDLMQEEAKLVRQLKEKSIEAERQLQSAEALFDLLTDALIQSRSKDATR